MNISQSVFLLGPTPTWNLGDGTATSVDGRYAGISKFQGPAWIGAQCRVWWGATNTWEQGTVIAYNSLKDEYLVLYTSDGEEHWESVDSLFQFADPETEADNRSLQQIQTQDMGIIFKELFPDGVSEETVREIIAKFYLLCGKDVHKTMAYFKSDIKAEQYPLLRLQPHMPQDKYLSVLTDCKLACFADLKVFTYHSRCRAH